MPTQKINCGKAHHWDIDSDTQIGTCKKCGEIKKFPTFDQLYENKKFTNRKQNAGVHPIEHSAMHGKSYIDLVINR